MWSDEATEATTTPHSASWAAGGVPLTAATAAMVAVAWGPLGVLHPSGEQTLAGETQLWLAVHWAQTALVPLVGLIMWRVLALPGRAATVARVAVMVWVAALAAFGGIAAIANGLLVEGGFPDAAAHLWEQTQTGVVLPIGVVAHLAWVVAAVAGSLALRRSGAPRSAQVAMMLAALLMATGHGDVFSSLGAIALAVAVFICLGTRVDDPGTGTGTGAGQPDGRVAFDHARLTAAPRQRLQAARHHLAGHRSALRRHGLAVAIVGALGCGVTTVLVATGVLAAGGGLLDNPEVTVFAATLPIALLVWRTLLRRHRAGRPDRA